MPHFSENTSSPQSLRRCSGQHVVARESPWLQMLKPSLRGGCRWIDTQRSPVVLGRRSGITALLMRDATVEVGEGEAGIQPNRSCVVRDRQVVPPRVEVEVSAVVGDERVARVKGDG